MAVSFQRKGSTASDWYSEGKAVMLGWEKDSAVLIFFDMGASGGTSNVQVTLDKESFQELALSMIQADRDAAIKAFGAALQWEPRSWERRRLD